MSLLHSYPHLYHLKNPELSRLSMALFIMTLGEALISVFVPIYLYQLSFEVYAIVYFYGLVSAYFLAFSYVGAKIVSRVGPKHAILLSTPFIVLYYVGLMLLPEHHQLLHFLPALLSVKMVLFNYGYHLVFLRSSHTKKRGSELALFGVIAVLAGAIAPSIGGLLAAVNYQLLFLASTVLIVAGALFLLLSKDNHEAFTCSISQIKDYVSSISYRGNAMSFSGYAIESIIDRTVWPVFIIITVGSVSQAGFVVSASLLVSLCAFTLIGMLADRINRVKLLKIGALLYSLAWLGRIFVDSATKIVAVDSYKNVAQKILHIPWAAHTYDLASHENKFLFIVSREIIFNASRIIFLPILALIFWLDFNPFITSFVIASIASLGYMSINRLKPSNR